MEKIKLYVRCVLSNGVKNKLRFILSIVGIFVGMLFLSCGTLLLDSYYNGKIEEVNNFSKDAFLIEEDYKTDIFLQLKDVTKDVMMTFYKYTTEQESLFLQKYGENTVSVNANIIGMYSARSDVLTVSQNEIYLQNVYLLKGRLINNEDVANGEKVIVIDEYTATILFPDENPIGKNIKLEGYNEEKNFDYEIIGVIRNSYYSDKSMKSLTYKLDEYHEELLMYETNVYIPMTVYDTAYCDSEKMYENNEEKVVYSWQDITDNKIQKLKTDVENIFGNDISIVDYSSVRKSIESQMHIYKEIFMLIFIVIFIFSGLNSMNIFFFSVKERVTEIGIRKAYGATNTDIVLLFVLEGIIVSIMAAIVAIFIGFILVIKTKFIAMEYFNIVLCVKIKIILIMFVMFVACFQAITFSLLPSLYASRIKVVDALHFE